MKSRMLVLIALMGLIAPSTSSAETIKRDILAVVDGAEIKIESDNLVAEYAAMPLNYLGFKISYADANKSLPSDEEMKRYGAIITWFTDNKLKGATDYAKWITRQLKAGKKLVVLDDFGFEIDENDKLTPTNVMDDFFRSFSVTYDPEYNTTSPLLVEIVKNDPEMTEFERKLAGDLGYFADIDATGKADVYLKLKRKDSGVTADAIFVHSKGGYVMSEYVFYTNPINYQTRWRINPFKFFAKALGSDFPKPDVTTLNGMRVFMSQVDGDGIRNISYVDKKTPCGQMTYDKVLTKYKVPVTLSIVIGDLVEAGDRERQRLYRTIMNSFALPNVEPASHGWAHPMIWKRDGRKMGFPKLKGYVYSPQNEIGESLKFINEYLVPKDKKTNLFLWTGDCAPDYDALKYVYDHKILNMNGGDTQFDRKYDSYTYVSSLFRNVGGLIQNFAPDANEYVLTNSWTGPFYGFRSIIETFENTESPIRLKPIDIYYHFYIMEHDISVDSVLATYDWALTQEIVPVFVSDYIHLLDGFLRAEIERISANSFRVTNNGALRTLRFDDSKMNVDVAGSRGVIGFTHHQGALYVHLDNGDRSEIRLTSAKPAGPYLDRANGRIRSWKSAGQAIDFTLYTMGRVQFSIKGLGVGKPYKVSAKGKDYNLKTESDGTLRFSEDILENKFEDVKISIRRG